MKVHLKVIPALVVLLFATFVFATQEVAPKSEWTPPTPRKSKTIFAPKPIGGDNIFKGNAEVWLADVIEEWGSDDLTPFNDKAITDYVTKVGNYVASYSRAPNKQYRFIVTNDEQHIDAMTAGGGRIFITLGMLEWLENEDELAAILAHEIGHDAFAHAGKTITRQMFWLTGTRKVKSPQEVEDAFAKLIEAYKKQPLASLTETVLGFSRFDELEADRAAFYNTYKAGYNPWAMLVLFDRTAKEQKGEMGNGDYAVTEFVTLLFGTHPPTTQRTMAIEWESNWVKMPAKNIRHSSAAFTAMKSHLSELEN